MAPLARVRALIAVFPGASFPLPVLSSVRSRGPSCREFVSPLARSRSGVLAVRFPHRVGSDTHCPSGPF